MPRPAPSVSRVVSLMALLSEHEAESLTLSRIARELDLNKATAHGIVTALTEAGYVIRHPEDKGYSLGPGLVRVGRAAIARAYEVAALARHEMETLAETAGGQCAMTAVHAGQINVIAVAGAPGGTPGARTGQRGPLLAPYGIVHVAWAPEVEVEAWLNGEPLIQEEKDGYRRLLAEVRERGFSVGTLAEERPRLEEAINLLVREALSPEVRQALGSLMAEMARERTAVSEIQPQRRYRLRMVTGPIFDADGYVCAALTLTGLPEITGAQVRDHAYAVSAAAGRISRRLGVASPVTVREPVRA